MDLMGTMYSINSSFLNSEKFYVFKNKIIFDNFFSKIILVKTIYFIHYIFFILFQHAKFKCRNPKL
jgi:hypothetical protein